MGEISEALRRANDAPTPAGPTRPPQPDSLSLGAEIARGRALSGDDASGDDASGDDASGDDPQGAAARSDAYDGASREHVTDDGPGRTHEPQVEQAISEDLEYERASARVCLTDPHCDASQGYRKLAFRLHSKVEELDLRSIVVSSTLAREGKTTTACNLAIELSRVDHSSSVALVEMDLRRPMVAQSLGLHPRVGIEDVLTDKAELHEAIVRTNVDGLDVIMARTPVANPSPHFSRARLTRLLDDLERRYSVVLIDTPPLVVGTDASVIMRYASGAILVAAEGVTPSRRIKQMAKQIPTEKFIGSVLNYARTKAARSEYDAYYYARHDNDGGTTETETGDGA